MKRTSRPRLVLWGRSLVFLAPLFVLTHCGKTSGPASGTFAAVYQNTLSGLCKDCHTPGGSAFVAGTLLDFSTQAQAFATLQNKVTGPTSVGNCGTVFLVKAGTPSSSYLAGVLFKDYPTTNFAGVTGCTPYSAHREPNGDQHLSADEKTSIVTWITNGAQNN